MSNYQLNIPSLLRWQVQVKANTDMITHCTPHLLPLLCQKISVEQTRGWHYKSDALWHSRAKTCRTNISKWWMLLSFSIAPHSLERSLFAVFNVHLKESKSLRVIGENGSRIRERERVKYTVTRDSSWRAPRGIHARENTGGTSLEGCDQVHRRCMKFISQIGSIYINWYLHRLLRKSQYDRRDGTIRELQH